eukprot:756237-Hanusia_phi.AAC.4
MRFGAAGGRRTPCRCPGGVVQLGDGGGVWKLWGRGLQRWGSGPHLRSGVRPPPGVGASQRAGELDQPGVVRARMAQTGVGREKQGNLYYIVVN